MFELPSGKVDFSDHSVFSALARELLEETGLKATTVVGELDPFTYITEKTVNGMQIASSKKVCIQLNYVVVIADGGEVVVNPKEHSEFVWASLEDFVHLDITEDMKGVIGNAFSWAEENINMVKG